MIALKGIIQNGQVKLSSPANLPDGTEVTIVPQTFEPWPGIPDDQWPTTPAGIAELLAHMDRVEPLDMTPAEEAAVEAWRQQVKQYTLAKQDSAVDGLFE